MLLLLVEENDGSSIGVNDCENATVLGTINDEFSATALLEKSLVLPMLLIGGIKLSKV